MTLVVGIEPRYHNDMHVEGSVQTVFDSSNDMFIVFTLL